MLTLTRRHTRRVLGMAMPSPRGGTSRRGEFIRHVSLYIIHKIIHVALNVPLLYRSQIRLCNIMEVDCSSYLTRVRHGSAMTQTEQADAWSRTRDHLRSLLHNLGSRVQYEDSHGSSQASSLFQCPTSTHKTTFQPDLPH